MTLDLAAPADSLRAFVKARASLDPVSTVVWFTGTVHAWDVDTQQQLFRIEGYNIARAVEIDGGYDLLTREAAFYLDPVDGHVLDRWLNPLTGEDVEAVHIWNDPVNQQLRLDGDRGPWHIPTTEIGEDIVFDVPVFLAYPSPLPRAVYPEYSQDDVYRAAELFQFFCRRADLADGNLPSVATLVSWTRLGPWLPFMRMGDRPGQLVYHAHGAKLTGGYADLPGWIRERVEATDPRFAAAPEHLEGRNETSWTYFRKLLEAGVPPTREDRP